MRYRDVHGLPAEQLAVVVWWHFASEAVLVDGARPVSQLTRLPEEDEVWGTAGDLVIGVLTAETLDRLWSEDGLR